MTGKILVVDPVATNRIVLKAKLSAHFYDAKSVADAAAALTAVRAETPDLIVIAERLSGHSADALCAALRAAPQTADLPVLILGNGVPDPGRAACLLAGADDVLDPSVPDAVLFARLRSLLHSANARRDLAARLSPSIYAEAAHINWQKERAGRIGWITTKRAAALGLQTRLTGLVPGRMNILDPTAVPGRVAGANDPELYVIDQNLGPHGSGLHLLGDLQARSHHQRAATLVILDEIDAGAAAFDLGASSVLTHPVTPEELAARIVATLRRKRQRDRLDAALDAGLAQAVRDPLTGLQNRRCAMDRLTALTATDQSTAVLMIDVDRFKSVNDAHGHAAGDAVLAAVAATLRESLSFAEILGRIGGEEFLAAFPVNCPSTARAAAERARRAMERAEIALPGAQTIPVTISIGVALWDPGMKMDEVLARADGALYQAKSEGRNGVILRAPLLA